MSHRRSVAVVLFAMMLQVAWVSGQVKPPIEVRDNQVYIYKLKHGAALNIAEVVNLVFNGTGGIGRGAPSSQPGRSTLRFERENPPPTPRRTDAPAPAGKPIEPLMGEVWAVGDPDTNALLITTKPAHWPLVKAILDDLDAAVPKVLIKAMVARITRDAPASDPLAGLSLNDPPTTAPAGGNSIDMADGAKLAKILDGLQQRQLLEVLSRPQVLMSAGELMTIAVGAGGVRVEPPIFPRRGEAAQEEHIELLVNLIPHVDAQGLITLDVASESSTLTSPSAQVAEQVSSPIKETRSTRARLIVSNGQTIVITCPAGTSAPARDRREPAPRTDLLIFLTARIAPPAVNP